MAEHCHGIRILAIKHGGGRHRNHPYGHTLLCEYLLRFDRYSYFRACGDNDSIRFAIRLDEHVSAARNRVRNGWLSLLKWQILPAEHEATRPVGSFERRRPRDQGLLGITRPPHVQIWNQPNRPGAQWAGVSDRPHPIRSNRV